MLLVYLLFALTFSTILLALFSEHIPERRKDDAFISFFAALMLLAWAVDDWLLPALAGDRKTPWPAVAALIIFGSVLASSLALSVRVPRRLRHAPAFHSTRFDAEAASFDLVLWLLMVTLGLSVMRSLGI